MEVKPGYQQTEVGVIPEEWEVWRLKDCCEKLNVSFVGTCEPFYTRENSGVLMLRTGNLQGDQIVLDDCKFVTREFHARNRKSQVRTGDILIARHGNSGNAVPVPPEIDDVNALSIVILRTNEAILGRRFASYCINSGPVRSQATGMLAGSTQVVINTREVEKLRLPLPPIPEQRAIAAALSDVDGLLGRLERLIAKKRDLKQAAMQQLLTGQTRLPGFHGEWEVKPLGELIVRLKKTTRPSSSGRAEGAYPFFTNTTKPVDRFLDEADFETEAIIANTGGEAYFNYYRGKFAAMADCFVFKTSVVTLFLYYFLKSVERAVNDNGFTGSGIKHLDKKYFSQMEVRCPADLPEQTAIAEVLTEMDGELAALEQRREKTHALKQAMMQELLTGRIRLVGNN